MMKYSQKKENKRKEIIDYITKYTLEHNYFPSIREIRDNCSMKSTSTIHEYLKEIEDMGYIETDIPAPAARAYRLAKYELKPKA